MLIDAADQEFRQGTVGTAYHYHQVWVLTLKGLKAKGDLTDSWNHLEAFSFTCLELILALGWELRWAVSRKTYT